MEIDHCLNYLHEAEEGIWMRRLNQVVADNRLAAWLSKLLPGEPSCHFETKVTKGCHNLCHKLFSEDGTAYLLRLPLVRRVALDYADEKVAMEVEAYKLIRKNTTMPVPKIYAWGLANANPLGLGPFILMEVIEGVTLGERFCEDSLLLKKEIQDCDIEAIYRQMAKFMLQLFKIDFPRIGSLPTPITWFPAHARPLSMKVHDLLHDAGVNAFGNRTQGFSTTSEYLHYTIRQDLQQIRDQTNSIIEQQEGESNFASLKILESMIPEMVNKDYDQGPFKLICDHLCPLNVIVRSQDDLTIVGMVDLEWVYVGPAQLFASAPWWRIFDHSSYGPSEPVNGEPLEISNHYLRHAEMFKRVLDEEEGKLSEPHEKELSKLIAWSEESGAMWLHELASNPFFNCSNLPFKQLQQKLGAEKWRKQMDEILGQDESKELLEKKPGELEIYTKKVEKVVDYKALLDNGDMTKEEFVTKVSDFLVNGDTSESSLLDKWIRPWW
ncbi:uncharacterized protein N7479_005198 [Penicillium vulpinum]|uniref:Uncharacterized protein n=1 Tax=Penicillium vulpinum TaxID=29845 RepID=A0A1V6REU0_9EURO|nr:uncharacterized protein N7479_005198 [Penicillium vulpinum]KAJ5958048.1 hypothetical protein N7479_005198 [Penicillium vulpinum]OQE00311.1 hypothetical protein PENVUL_c054G02712 [Penicillium vulpinum]